MRSSASPLTSQKPIPARRFMFQCPSTTKTRFSCLGRWRFALALTFLEGSPTTFLFVTSRGRLLPSWALYCKTFSVKTSTKPSRTFSYRRKGKKTLCLREFKVKTCARSAQARVTKKTSGINAENKLNEILEQSIASGSTMRS